MKRSGTTEGFEFSNRCSARRRIEIQTLEQRVLMSVSVIQDLSIDPRANGQPAYDQFVVSNGIGFFKRYGASGIGSLWTTNGVTATEIKSISPGFDFLEMLPVKAGIAAVDADVFGHGIWRSDGTAAGTYKIGKIEIVHTDPGLSPAESFNGKYYINEESFPGGEIAVTDGNTFWTGIAEEWGGMCTYPNGVVFNGSSGMFTLDDNGTVTRFVDRAPTATHFARADAPFNVHNNGIVFIGEDWDNGSQVVTYSLWRTNATTAVTVQLPFTVSGDRVIVRIIGSDGQRALFAVSNSDGNDSIWSTDGTAEGTAQIVATNSVGYYSSVIGDVNGKILFEITNDADPNHVTLWTTQGTAATTQQIATIDRPQYGAYTPPYNYLSGMSPGRFVLANGFAYFVNSDPAHGAEIWQTDGTASGTHIAVDVVPGPDSSYPILDGVVNDRLVFNGVPSPGAAPTLLAYDPRLRPVPIHTPVQVAIIASPPEKPVASVVAKHSKLDAIDLLDGVPGLN